MPLTVSACRTLCDWAATGASYEDLPLFACGGCGAQWVRTEPWTPCNDDGLVPQAIRAERAAAAAGSAGS